MRIRFALLPLLITQLCGAAEPAKTKVVAEAPDKKFRIETEKLHTLKVTERGVRQVGSQFEGPSEVWLVRAADGEVLMKLARNLEGPVYAHWCADSSHVIIGWFGYRFNWERILVRVTGTPGEIDLDKCGIHEVIRHDTRPVWQREAQTFEGEPDTSPPFEKKRWYITPSGWVEGTRLLVSAIEASRRSEDPHPFEQGVTWYAIEAEITPKGLIAHRLFEDGDIEREKPLWTRGAEE